eukprot:Sspe_Gene.22031::Locus_8316_Transcript_1_1_Confidence_1.000_Length_2149::g.22031::m.22031
MRRERRKQKAVAQQGGQEDGLPDVKVEPSEPVDFNAESEYPTGARGVGESEDQGCTATQPVLQTDVNPADVNPAVGSSASTVSLDLRVAGKRRRESGNVILLTNSPHPVTITSTKLRKAEPMATPATPAPVVRLCGCPTTCACPRPHCCCCCPRPTSMRSSPISPMLVDVAAETSRSDHGSSASDSAPGETQHLLVEMITQIYVTRCPPEKSEESLAAIVQNHWRFLPQALRVVEWMYGPGKGRPPLRPVDNERRLAAFLSYYRGHKGLEQDAEERYSDMLHEALEANAQELYFLRLEHEVGRQREPPEKFEKSLEERLTELYAAYCPDRVDQVDSTLAQAAPHGEQLIRAVIERYGWIPGEVDISLPPSPKARLRALLRKHSPEHVRHVERWARLYSGQMEQLVLSFVKLYGPVDPGLTWAEEADEVDEDCCDDDETVELQKLSEDEVLTDVLASGLLSSFPSLDRLPSFSTGGGRETVTEPQDYGP